MWITFRQFADFDTNVVLDLHHRYEDVAIAVGDEKGMLPLPLGMGTSVRATSSSSPATSSSFFSPSKDSLSTRKTRRLKLDKRTEKCNVQANIRLEDRTTILAHDHTTTRQVYMTI
jgi:hypothetical protein